MCLGALYGWLKKILEQSRRVDPEASIFFRFIFVLGASCDVRRATMSRVNHGKFWR